MKIKSIESYNYYSSLVWILSCSVFVFAVSATVIKGSWDEKTTCARTALLESLAISSLAITSECDSARSPIEGFCSSARDIPGGYPYHSSCDIVSPSKILKQQSFTIKILKHN